MAEQTIPSNKYCLDSSGKDSESEGDKDLSQILKDPIVPVIPLKQRELETTTGVFAAGNVGNANLHWKSLLPELNEIPDNFFNGKSFMQEFIFIFNIG